MRFKTKDNVCIEFGDWELINDIYWFRKDLSEPRSKWAKQVLFKSNNVVGFLMETFAPRFFGSEVAYLIEEWSSYSFNMLPHDVEKAKQTMDNFLEPLIYF